MTTDERELFATKLAEYDTLRGSWLALLPIHVEMEEELLSLLREAAPKMKIKLPPPPSLDEVSAANMRAYSERWCQLRALCIKKLGEQVQAVVAKYEERSISVRDERIDRERALRDELREIAARMSPRAATTWMKISEVSENTYHTQGGGSRAYGHTEAELRALDFLDAGLDAEVRWRPRNSKLRSGVYEVWVLADPLEVEIVNYGHGLGLSEWLQQVVARSMNPRVLSPFLPWGIEEKFGTRAGIDGAQLLRPVRTLELAPSSD